MSARLLGLVMGMVFAAGVVSGVAWAQPQVLDGDPIDPSTGAPYILLPGVGLVLPGPDGKFNTTDDLIDGSIVGDVDLVVRAGIVGAVGGIPDPPTSIGSAPAMIAGGGFGGAVPEVPFQVFLSDGVTPPAAGHLLSGSELDGRGVFLLAYADIDGDGFVGPTSTDGDGDNAIELQEVYSPVGRQVALFQGGVAQGSIGVRLGAPASVGGLGIVLVGGAATGNVGPVYTDGTWVATQLPFMPPTDPRDLVGRGNVPPPDPSILVDVRIDTEFDPEDVFLPAPGHPVLGTPYAVPTDGSSPTVGLARSESGAATCAGIALAVDPGTYQPVVKKRLLSLAAAGGARIVAEPASSIEPLPGGSLPTVYLYPADRLGNPADPTVPLTAIIEVGPEAGLTVPDTDGDAHRETVVLSSAEAVVLTLDTSAAGAGNQITVLANGAICSSGPVSGGGIVTGPPSTMVNPVTTVAVGRKPDRGRVSLRAVIQPPGDGIDPLSQEVEVTIAAGANVIFSRVIPTGSFVRRRKVSLFKDDRAIASARVAAMALRERRRGGGYSFTLRVRSLDLSSFDTGATALVQTLRIGDALFSIELPCQENGRGTVVRCRL